MPIELELVRPGIVFFGGGGGGGGAERGASGRRRRTSVVRLGKARQPVRLEAAGLRARNRAAWSRRASIGASSPLLSSPLLSFAMPCLASFEQNDESSATTARLQPPNSHLHTFSCANNRQFKRPAA